MVKTLEAIIKENIPVQGIARAIRAHGYKISPVKKSKHAMDMTGYVEGGLTKMLCSPERFTKLDDGWIRDKYLGIDWGSSSDKRMNWNAAKTYCSKEGGRLPERFELLSLVDDTRRDPAINKEIFSDTVSDLYWSGTTYAYWSDDAWIVSFGVGHVYDVDKAGNYCVRPVRSSQ